jgi:hypothetical protein
LLCKTDDMVSILGNQEDLATEQESFELPDGFVHYTRPAKSIDATVVLPNQLPNTAQMSFSTAESLEYLWLVSSISFPTRSST